MACRKEQISMSLRCPTCSNPSNYVVDSRSHDGEYIRRRRLCTNCGCRYSTYEIFTEQFTELSKLAKIKKKLKELETVIR